MSGFVPADGRVSLLTYLGTQGLYLGLATAIPSGNDVTLANITEVNAAGYARTAVGGWSTPTSADFNVDPIQMFNANAVNFPTLTADMTPAPYVFLTDTASGSALAAPVLSTLAAPTTGGTFTAGTYYWVITALNAKGETIASNEKSQTLTANQEQALSWGAVSGATSYNVYRGTSAGGENVLVHNGTGTTYTDTGTSVQAQSPPGSNTAAIGKVYYVWTAVQPVTALAGQPIVAPANQVVIE